MKTAAGYEPTTNLLDVMIGQEGTLGVITKAWLKVVPLPEVLGLMVFFSSFEQCLQAVEGLKKGAVRYRKGIVTPTPDAISPRAIEFFDRNAIDFMSEKLSGIPECKLWFDDWIGIRNRRVFESRAMSFTLGRMWCIDG